MKTTGRQYVITDKGPTPKKRKYNAGYIEKKGEDLEIKSIDIVNASDPTSGTPQAWLGVAEGQITALNLVAPGTAAWARIGRQITLKRLRIRGSIVLSGIATAWNAGPEYKRFLVVYDKQPNGAAPELKSILAYFNATLGLDEVPPSFYLAFKNLNNEHRYEILMDKGITLPSRDDTASNNHITATADKMHMEWDVNLGDRSTIFGSNSASASAFASGALWFLCLGNSATGAQSYVWDGCIRLEFTDA